MSKAVKGVLKAVSSVMVGIVITLAILLVGVRAVGLQPYTILSPSMKDVYPTGSLIYVKKTDPASLDVKDVITFRISENMTATHRIIELVPDEDDPGVVRFRTKGDNNDSPDGALVEYSDVLGTPVFCIPLLGFLAQYIQSPSGSVVAITVGIASILFVSIVDIVTDDKDKKRDKGEKVNEKA